MNRITGVFLILFCFFSLIARAEENVSKNNGKETLGFDAYIEKITSALPEIKSNGVNLLLQENAVQSAKSLGDITVTGGGNYYSNDALMGSTPGVISGKEVYAGVSKHLVSTGTDLGVKGDYTETSYSDFVTPADYSTYIPSVSFSVKQPLLYNFLGKVDRFSEEDARMKVEIEKVRLLENNKSVVGAYKKLYFQWMLSRDVISNMEDAVKNSEILRDQVGRNLRAGISEDDDYQRAAASVLMYEQQLQGNMMSLNNIEHQLNIYIETDKNAPEGKEFDKYVNMAMENNYEFISFEKTNSGKIIDLSMKELLYAKGVSDNKLLPDLYATAGYTRKNLATDPDDKYSGLPDHEYSLGVGFTYKLGNNQAESNAKTVELQIQSLKYEYEAALNNYKKNVAGLKESVERTKIILQKKKAYMESLNKRLAIEMKKYRQGRLGLSYIIDTQNSIASVKTEILNTKYQLISYYFDYLNAVM